MDSKAVFSTNIRILLAKQGMTGTDLAKVMGVESGTVYAWMKGRALPKPDKINKIAAYFHVSVGTLFSETIEFKIS